MFDMKAEFFLTCPAINSWCTIYVMVIIIMITKISKDTVPHIMRPNECYMCQICNYSCCCAPISCCGAPEVCCNCCGAPYSSATAVWCSQQMLRCCSSVPHNCCGAPSSCWGATSSCCCSPINCCCAHNSCCGALIIYCGAHNSCCVALIRCFSNILTFIGNVGLCVILRPIAYPATYLLFSLSISDVMTG